MLSCIWTQTYVFPRCPSTAPWQNLASRHRHWGIRRALLGSRSSVGDGEDLPPGLLLGRPGRALQIQDAILEPQGLAGGLSQPGSASEWLCLQGGVRSRARSVLRAHRVRSRAAPFRESAPEPLRSESPLQSRSIPRANRVRSRARSVPRAHRVRSRAAPFRESAPEPLRSESPQSPLQSRYVPRAHRVRSRARSVPRAHRVRSRAAPFRESTPEPLRSESPQSPLHSESPQSPLRSMSPQSPLQSRSVLRAHRVRSRAAPFWEPTESAPELLRSVPRVLSRDAPFREPTESTPFREPTESAPALPAPPWPPTLLAPPWHPWLSPSLGPLPLHGPGTPIPPPTPPPLCHSPCWTLGNIWKQFLYGGVMSGVLARRSSLSPPEVASPFLLDSFPLIPHTCH